MSSKGLIKNDNAKKNESEEQLTKDLDNANEEAIRIQDGKDMKKDGK